MLRRIVSGIMLSLVSIGLLSLAFDIQPSRAEFGNIYIRAEGNVDPPDAPILSADNVTYTFIGDIVTNGSIVVQRDNIVVDGAGHVLQGTPESEKGIYLSDRRNETIRNMEIKGFGHGVKLDYSSNNTISGNYVTNNAIGIELQYTNNTLVHENNVTNNALGAWLSSSSNNIISGNNITNNYYGVQFFISSNDNTFFRNNIIASKYDGFNFYSCSNNTIIENNVINNNEGVFLQESSINRFYHNNFIDNAGQVHIIKSGYVNFWDNGYPSGGNHWSDYNDTDFYNGPNQNETGSDGIGDTPYVIDGDNIDHYPLMNPYGAPPPQTYSLKITTTVGGTTNPTPGTHSYIANSTIEVTAIPDANYLFDHWELDSVNVGSANPYPVLIDNDHTLHSVFTYEGIHDIAVTNVTPSETIVGKGHSMSINVTIANQGDYTENFNLTVYANATVIHTFTNLTLTSGNTTTITFTWNTTSVSDGNYTIKAYAWPVPNETDTDNNLYVDGTVQIVSPIHDIAITHITFSKQNPKINETIYIYVTIENQGNLAETFDISVNYTRIIDPLISTQTITLAPRESITLNFTWTPITSGRYEIKAYTSTIPNDTNPSDNTKTSYLYVTTSSSGGGGGGGGRWVYCLY